MNKKYDIVFIGHIDKTILKYLHKGQVIPMTGGAVYFACFPAVRSGAKTCVLTKLAKKDSNMFDDMKKEGIDIIAIDSPETTSCENIFETEDMDKRKVVLVSQADPFTVKDIPDDLDTKIFHFAGLFANEFPNEMIEHVAKTKKDVKIGLDLQSKLRWSKDGVFSWLDWKEKKKYLPYVTFLKADTAESEIITGTADKEKAAKILFDWGAKEIMITHTDEVIVYDGKKFYSAPFNPSNLSGRTGRGDTTSAAYMVWRLNHDIEESIKYSAALCSIKMEKIGPFKGSIKDVQERMKNKI